MSYAQQHDIGAFLAVKNSALSRYIATGTAAGTASTENGATVDRLALNHLGNSCKVAIPYRATNGVNGSTSTWTVAWHLQHTSHSSAGWANTTDADGNSTHTVTHTGSSLATTSRGAATADWKLSLLKRYVRVHIKITQGGSSTSVDTLIVGGNIIVGGQEQLPAGTTAY